MTNNAAFSSSNSSSTPTSAGSDSYAMVINRFGSADEFTKQSQLQPPELLHDEVLVHTTAIGANPLDYKMRDGSSGLCKNLTFPCTLGREFAGIVAAVGAGVADFEVGERVFGMRAHDDSRGAYASDLVVPANILVSSPTDVSDESLAGLSTVALTALECVDTLGQVSEGDTVLIHGAGGGVGQLMTQFAVKRGARVLAAASTKHAERLKRWGAEHIDYTQVDTFEEVRKVAPNGVDVVLDGVYFDTFLPSLDLLADGGRIVAVPSLANLTPAKDRKYADRGIIAAVPAIAPDPATMTTIAAKLGQGEIELHIGQKLPLTEVAKAHHILEDGHADGKIILLP